MSPYGRLSRGAEPQQLGRGPDVSSRTYKKEMGITHADFFRLLPVAVATDQYVTTATSATAESNGKSFHIELGPEGERRIALLSVPQTSVTITLEGYSDDEAENAMATFYRAYQRGGG